MKMICIVHTAHHLNLNHSCFHLLNYRAEGLPTVLKLSSPTLLLLFQSGAIFRVTQLASSHWSLLNPSIWILKFEIWDLRCAKIREVRILLCWRSPRTRRWRTRLPWSSLCSPTCRPPSTSCYTTRCPPTSFTTTWGNISSGSSPPSLRPLSRDVPG